MTKGDLALATTVLSGLATVIMAGAGAVLAYPGDLVGEGVILTAMVASAMCNALLTFLGRVAQT